MEFLEAFYYLLQWLSRVSRRLVVQIDINPANKVVGNFILHSLNKVIKNIQKSLLFEHRAAISDESKFDVSAIAQAADKR